MSAARSHNDHGVSRRMAGHHWHRYPSDEASGICEWEKEAVCVGDATSVFPRTGRGENARSVYYSSTKEVVR
jgi:hypothetical protein